LRQRDVHKKSDDSCAPNDSSCLEMPTDLWVIKGKVYDFTTWTKHHPGGAAILNQSKGSDATALFESYHAVAESTKGKEKMGLDKALKRYYVRDARANEQDISVQHDWVNTPHYDKLKQNAQAYFQKNGSKAPWFIKLWHFSWSILYFGLAYRWIMYGKIWEAALMGAASLYGPGDAGHSGTHYEIFKSAKLNILFANVVAMWQFVPSGWTRQHVMMHHTRPTYTGDVDIHHLAFFNFWRLSKHEAWRWHHKYWFFKWPIAVTAIGLALPIVDASTLFVELPYLVDNVRHKAYADKWEYAKTFMQFMAQCCLWGTIVIRHGPATFFAPWLVFGFLFYSSAQLSHGTHEAQVDRENTKDEWILQQVRSTRGDHSPYSLFWTAFSIGLNNQAVHHCFPSCHWYHYPALNDIVLEATGEIYGVNRYKATFWEAYRDHLTFVNEVNKKP